MMSLFQYNSVRDVRCSLYNENDEWSGFKDTAFVERYLSYDIDITKPDKGRATVVLSTGLSQKKNGPTR